MRCKPSDNPVSGINTSHRVEKAINQFRFTDRFGRVRLMPAAAAHEIRCTVHLASRNKQRTFTAESRRLESQHGSQVRRIVRRFFTSHPSLFRRLKRYCVGKFCDVFALQNKVFSSLRQHSNTTGGMPPSFNQWMEDRRQAKRNLGHTPRCDQRWYKAQVQSLQRIVIDPTAVMPVQLRKRIEAALRYTPKVIRRGTGRVFHPLTSFPKEYRQHLRYRMPGGKLERLVEVDMHAANLAIVSAWGSSHGVRPHIVKLLQSGDAYGGLGGSKTDAIKGVFYGRNQLAWSNVAKAFHKLAPTLWGYLKGVQQRGGNSALRRKIERGEANLFLDTIAPALVENGCPAVTIHDCVMVPASMAEKAKRTCEILAEQQLGFVPVFKVK